MAIRVAAEEPAVCPFRRAVSPFRRAWQYAHERSAMTMAVKVEGVTHAHSHTLQGNARLEAAVSS